MSTVLLVMRRDMPVLAKAQRSLHVFIRSKSNKISDFNKIIQYGLPKLSYNVLRENASVANERPIVMLHGMFGSKANWKSIARALNMKTGRQVISFDARNHGESEHHISMSYDAMTFDLFKLVKNRGISQFDIIGHSMGGKSAMCFALRHPSMIKKLVIVDSAPSTSVAATAAVKCLEAMMQLNLKEIKSYMAANEALKNDIKDDGIRQFILTNLKFSDGSARWILNLQFFRKNMGSLLGFPQFSASRFVGPTLFVAGKKSNYITNQEIPEILQLFPKAKIDYIDEAGHWVHSDQPERFIRAVCSFLMP